MERETLVDDLLRPEAHAQDVERVELIQTHISWLFFAGQRVYKVKKPVDLGFVDFRTLERRKHFCEEEVRLNAELAPGVHLGVVPITEDADGKARIRGDGDAIDSDAIDWAIEMVRLPASRMLEAMLERGEVDNALMDRIAELLVRFHGKAPTGGRVDELGSPEVLEELAEQNFEQLAPFAHEPGGEPADAVRALTPAQLTFLTEEGRRAHAKHLPTLRRRVEQGRVREGHGDLHAGNICCLSDRVLIYDRIEFDESFRCGDVGLDLAFLTMGLDHEGFPGFAGYLTKRYATVAEDPELPELASYLRSYRAIVRGKVSAMAAADPGFEDAKREAKRLEAMRYLQLATGYSLEPRMILLCGLPACGKSTVAHALARPLRARVLRSDVRRKQGAGPRPRDPGADEYGAGLYTEESKRAVYASMLEDALETLRHGHTVIVDATFSRREYRRPFVDALQRLGLPWELVHVTAPEDVTRERLRRRADDPDEPSDADLEVYRKAVEAFEPPTELPEGHRVEVTSVDEPPEEQASAVLDALVRFLSNPS